MRTSSGSFACENLGNLNGAFFFIFVVSHNYGSILPVLIRAFGIFVAGTLGV